LARTERLRAERVDHNTTDSLCRAKSALSYSVVPFARAQTEVSPDRQSLPLGRRRELPGLGLILAVVREEDVWQFDARGVLPNER